MGVGKILIGIILVIVGLWAIIPVDFFGPGQGGLGLISDLWTVIKGVVPAFLVFIGAILVWIESEELKISRPKRRKRRR